MMRNMMFVLIVLAAMPSALFAETTLLDFNATWCGPCQGMKPVVERLKQDGYAVKEIDVDLNRETAQRFGVTSIPCFVFMDDGREIDRVVGPVSYEHLAQRLKPAHWTPKVNHPTPAWRYVKPEGPHAAVVRIICTDGPGGRCLGSGVLVCWNGRLVFVTARHVIKGAKSISVRAANGKTYRVRILGADGNWDCAVLEPLERIEGIEPAEIEFGETAVQKRGDRLESCGFGSDETLASNYGLFIGYKRSTNAPAGPDDWMEISGRARPGDSGGPVFNDRGRVVGILWGTDGDVVVCVQPGRLHATLEAAVPREYMKMAAIERHPTPPMNDPGPTWRESRDAPNVVVSATPPQGEYVLPYRNTEAAKEAATAAELQRISEILQQIEANQRQNQSGPPPVIVSPPPTTPTAPASAEPPSLRERIHDKAEEVKEKIDGVLESPFAKHLAAILGIVFVIGIGTWIAISQHRKAGTKTLVERGADALATATAGTPIGTVTNLVDKTVTDLGQRLRDLDAKFDAKIQSVQQQVTQTALATPAPTQTPPGPVAATAPPVTRN
jgi:thioredoxin 1